MAYHSPKEVEQQLNIKTATLRKYASKLEAVGYEFERNDQGHRYYRTEDVLSLEKLIQIKDRTNMILEDCAAAVMKWKDGDSEFEDEPVVEKRTRIIEEHAVINPEPQYPSVPNEMVQTLVNTIQRYEDIMQTQQQMLQAQQEMVEKVLAGQNRMEEMQAETKQMYLEQKLSVNSQERMAKESVELLSRSKDQSQMLTNQIAGLRNDMKAKQVREDQEAKQEVKQEKSRSFWQRLFSPSS